MDRAATDAEKVSDLSPRETALLLQRADLLACSQPFVRQVDTFCCVWTNVLAPASSKATADPKVKLAKQRPAWRPAEGSSSCPALPDIVVQSK